MKVLNQKKLYVLFAKKIVDYKIILYDCKGGHKLNNLFLDDFNNTQMINESDIICSDCHEQNKYKSYQKKFFKCLTCEQNLCPLCNQKHNKQHITIDYDQKNYKCRLHNDIYTLYCKNCKINICMNCFPSHDKSNHEIIDYKSIIPDNNKINNELNELRNDINILNEFINNVMEKLQKVKEKMELFYLINSEIFKHYIIQNKNYQILKNIKEIRNNIERSNIKDIINNESIGDKIEKLLDIYDKMTKEDPNHNIIINNKNNKEINLSKKNTIPSEEKRRNTLCSSTKDLKINDIKLNDNNENNSNKKKLDNKPKEIKNNNKKRLSTKPFNEIGIKNNEKNKQTEKIKDKKKTNEKNNEKPKSSKNINEMHKISKKINENNKLAQKSNENNKPKEENNENIKPTEIINEKNNIIEEVDANLENLDENEIIIKYKINKSEKEIKIFGDKFVSNNEKNCTIKFDNEIMKIKEKLEIPKTYKNKEEIEIKLINIFIK